MNKLEKFVYVLNINNDCGLAAGVANHIEIKMFPIFTRDAGTTQSKSAATVFSPHISDTKEAKTTIANLQRFIKNDLGTSP